MQTRTGTAITIATEAKNMVQELKAKVNEGEGVPATGQWEGSNLSKRMEELEKKFEEIKQDTRLATQVRERAWRPGNSL